MGGWISLIPAEVCVALWGILWSCNRITACQNLWEERTAPVKDERGKSLDVVCALAFYNSRPPLKGCSAPKRRSSGEGAQALLTARAWHYLHNALLCPWRKEIIHIRFFLSKCSLLFCVWALSSFSSFPIPTDFFPTPSCLFPLLLASDWEHASRLCSPRSDMLTVWIHCKRSVINLIVPWGLCCLCE